MRRRVLLPLDKLILGGNPNKLKQTDSPAASPREAVPLSQKERARLLELSTRRTQGPLTPAETYELLQLQRRRGA
jgi:hypothetical protein